MVSAVDHVALSSVRFFCLSGKSIALNEALGQVVFYVTQGATKSTVKTAVEAMFGIKVRSVRVINNKGALVRTKVGIRRRSACRKMVVSVDGDFRVSKVLKDYVAS
jgi:large subunit ribosomal protein L23